MSDATSHDVLAVDPEDGVSPADVSTATLRSGLESDEEQVRTHAARVAAALAKTDPTAIDPLLPTLVDRLDDEWNVVVYQTLIALSQVAESDAAKLEPAVPGLVELTQRDLPLVRAVAARILGFVGLDHPEFFVDHVEVLLTATATEPTDILDDEDLDLSDLSEEQRRHHRQVNEDGRKRHALAREITANLLVEVADHDHAVLVPHVETFADLLADADAGVVAASADVLGTIASEDPDAVGEAVDPLCDCLDHFDDAVVANAVSALGYAGDPAAVDPLREVADDDDRDEELTDLAADTADFLADRR